MTQNKKTLVGQLYWLFVIIFVGCTVGAPPQEKTIVTQSEKQATKNQKKTKREIVKDSSYYYSLARKKEKKKQIQIAITNYEKSYDLATTDKQRQKAWKKLVSLHLEMNHYQKALEVINKYPNWQPSKTFSMKIYNRGMQLKKTKNYPLAKSYFEIASKTPDSIRKSRALYQEGATLEKMQSNPSLAYDLYEKSFQVDPSNHQNHSKLMAWYEKNKNTVRLLSVLEAAIKVRPEDSEVIFKIARLYSQNDEDKLAIKYYQKLVVLEPDNFLANINLARKLRQQDEYQKALLYYGQALLLKPKRKDIAKTIRKLKKKLEKKTK